MIMHHNQNKRTKELCFSFMFSSVNIINDWQKTEIIFPYGNMPHCVLTCKECHREMGRQVQQFKQNNDNNRLYITTAEASC